MSLKHKSQYALFSPAVIYQYYESKVLHSTEVAWFSTGHRSLKKGFCIQTLKEYCRAIQCASFDTFKAEISQLSTAYFFFWFYPSTIRLRFTPEIFSIPRVELSPAPQVIRSRSGLPKAACGHLSILIYPVQFEYEKYRSGSPWEIKFKALNETLLSIMVFDNLHIKLLSPLLII